MGLRFRKSKKLLPGVKLNISKNSVGLSVGVKGARVSVNSKGRVTKSVSIPGTGISHVTTENLNSKKALPNNPKPQSSNTGSNDQNKPKQNKVKKVFGILFFISGLYGLTHIQNGIYSVLAVILCFVIGYLLFRNKK